MFSSKIYDKRDDFDFDIVNFSSLDGDVLNLFDLLECLVNARNKTLNAKLLNQGFRYHKFRETLSKFHRRHYELVSKFKVGLRSLLQQGLSGPEFYDDLV